MKNKVLYEVGQRIKDEKRDLTITEITRIKNSEGKKIAIAYKYKCNICGFDCGEHYKNGEYKKELFIKKGNLNRNKAGCACCGGRIVVVGINDILTTAPWMIELGMTVEDSKKHTKYSTKKVIVKCPYCKMEHKKVIGNMYRHKTIGCLCGNGYSYAERFLGEILNQLNIKYKTQLNKKDFDWIDKYRYDFYFELDNKSYIIETHGEQHYRKANRFKNTLEEEQENDRLKFELAKNNGIDNYIVIDCRYSEKEYIKKSILNSKLADILDFSMINWIKCEKYSLGSLVKEVCDYWNNKKETEIIVDLGRKFNLSKDTIRNYLKKGSSLGWCEYTPGDARKIYLKKEDRKSGKKKKRVEISKDGVVIGVFNSISELSKKSEEMLGVSLKTSSISDTCNGKCKHYKGYNIKFLENEQDNE